MQAIASYPEKPAPAGHGIHELLTRRWSPRAFDESRPVARADLMALIEAARWAPSCFNEQPWRYLVFDRSNPGPFRQAQQCVLPFNAWACKAPALILSVAKERFTSNGNPNRHALHDLGLATANLLIEATTRGLVVHPMGGFDAERARREFQIPAGFTPVALMAVGYPFRGGLGQLTEPLRAMEAEPRRRKALGEIAFDGQWHQPLG